jgi:hypothetical protein
VKDFEMWGLWEGPGEPSIRSVLTPTSDELQRHVADQGRFESRLLHWGPPRKPPGEIRYTLRVVLADGRAVTSATSVRYVDACPPPMVHTSLATGPTGRIGFQTATLSASDFLRGIKAVATTVIWGDLELPPGRVERSPAVVLVHGSGGVEPREDRWTEELRAAGVATFSLDSFTGRGIASTATDQSQLGTLAVPPPAQQVAALHERLLEEAGLTHEKRIELTKRLIESIEQGLEAMTVKGPQSVRVADNMARMRAAELLAQILNVGTAASRRESSTAPSVVINVTEPEWLRNPSSQHKVPSTAVIDVLAVKEDVSEP